MATGGQTLGFQELLFHSEPWEMLEKQVLA